MFFPDRIKSIKPSDTVLEIGPGSTPHPRSDIYLEKVFTDKDEFRLQRGNTPELQSSKPVVFYEGEVFPFKDREFDYVICSHVLEHVPDAEIFLKEVVRVAARGYLEFPTVYYDYVYNIPVHTLFLMHKHGKIYWMKKKESGLEQFSEIQYLFFESLLKEHYGIINSLKEYFIQGFEWIENVECVKVSSVNDVCYDRSNVAIQKFAEVQKGIGLKKELSRKLNEFFLNKK
ncbi:MAG: methyltransferase domain-containing protein [Bacteroidota bacterium]